MGLNPIINVGYLNVFVMIGEMMNLEEMYLSSNRLETLPSSIGLLRKLLCLELDSNRLQSLPSGQ